MFVYMYMHTARRMNKKLHVSTHIGPQLSPPFGRRCDVRAWRLRGLRGIFAAGGGSCRIINPQPHITSTRSSFCRFDVSPQRLHSSFRRQPLGGSHSLTHPASGFCWRGRVKVERRGRAWVRKQVIASECLSTKETTT